MNLNNLPKATHRKKRRLGQGHGSGRVKTAGRGTKGQKARGKIPQRIKLAGVSFVKRLPLIRGKLRNKNITLKSLVINLKDLEGIKSNTVIDLEFLKSQKLINSDTEDLNNIKLLGDGEISVPLTVKIRTSHSAKKKIEKAGGTVEVESRNPSKDGLTQ